MSVGYTTRDAERLRKRIREQAGHVNAELKRLVELVPDHSIRVGYMQDDIDDIAEKLDAIVRRRVAE